MKSFGICSRFLQEVLPGGLEGAVAKLVDEEVGKLLDVMPSVSGDVPVGFCDHRLTGGCAAARRSCRCDGVDDEALEA